MEMSQKPRVGAACRALLAGLLFLTSGHALSLANPFSPVATPPASASEAADADRGVGSELAYARTWARPGAGSPRSAPHLRWPCMASPELRGQAGSELEDQVWAAVPAGAGLRTGSLELSEARLIALLKQHDSAQERGLIYYGLAFLFSGAPGGNSEKAAKYAWEALANPQDDPRAAELHDMLGELRHRQYLSGRGPVAAGAREDALRQYLLALVLVVRNQKPIDPTDARELHTSHFVNGPTAQDELERHRAAVQRVRLQQHLCVRRAWLVALSGQLLAGIADPEAQLNRAADAVLTDQAVLAEILASARVCAARAAATQRMHVQPRHTVHDSHETYPAPLPPARAPQPSPNK